MNVREIKFRAWCNVNKEMLDVWEIDWNEKDDIKGDGNIWKISCFASEDKGYAVQGMNPHTPLMQYTGIKDKNGKEIYEDDIVYYEGFKELDEVDIISKVSWGRWCYVIQENRAFDTIKATGFEIIGNIYENPELLK